MQSVESVGILVIRVVMLRLGTSLWRREPAALHGATRLSTSPFFKRLEPLRECPQVEPVNKENKEEAIPTPRIL